MQNRIHITIVLLCSLSPLIARSQNLVSSASWSLGSGSVGIFEVNGTAAENIRESGIGPHGNQTVLWKAIPNAEGNASGGWNTQSFSIDRTKMYRFAVWIKKTNSTDGTTYFGCGSNDILNLSGGIRSNPYFWYGDLPTLNKWYLLVGYVHASDDPSTNNYGGIYDGETGEKIVTITDFKFSETATIAMHRAYLYYDVNGMDRQYFYGPEVYQVQSNQPLTEFNSTSIFTGNTIFSKKVGIGTATPQGNLHVDGASPEIYITSEDWAAIRGNEGTWLFGYTGPLESEEISIGTRDQTGTRTLVFAAGGTTRMKILANGNVGIGTTIPNELLTVNGTIYGKEVKIDLSVPGPDYVFEENYDLRSLDEIRAFIEENKHLPDVPSAQDMKKHGISLGEMNMLLLRKIEELTLYVIEQQKQIETLKAERCRD